MSLLENAPGGGFMITKRRRYVLEVGEPVLARHVTLSASAARKYPSLWPLKRSECLCQRQTATAIFEVWRSRITWHGSQKASAAREAHASASRLSEHVSELELGARDQGVR